MPTPAANLIPQEESTFNRPGFWDFAGAVQIGGGAPVAVQSMTMTETADAAATARQKSASMPT